MVAFDVLPDFLQSIGNTFEKSLPLPISAAALPLRALGRSHYPGMDGLKKLQGAFPAPQEGGGDRRI